MSSGIELSPTATHSTEYERRVDRAMEGEATGEMLLALRLMPFLKAFYPLVCRTGKDGELKFTAAR